MADKYVEFGQKYIVFIVCNYLCCTRTRLVGVQDDDGNLLTREALLQRLYGRIQTLVGRYEASSRAGTW